MNKPFVLSISGFDPSAGAGVLADAKAIEAQGGYALAVISALTHQTENACYACVEAPLWKENLELMLSFYQVSCIKIGLLAHREQKQQLFEILEAQAPSVPLVWDPVLSASAGFSFHDANDFLECPENLRERMLITPNAHELRQLAPHAENHEQAAQELSRYSALCITGVRPSPGKVRDELWMHGECTRYFSHKEVVGYKKHGSGCVFASSLAVHLSRGFTLEEACEKAQHYTRTFLLSSSSLLGSHSFQESLCTEKHMNAL